MACAGGHEREGSCAELVATGLLEFIPDSHHEGALHDRHVLIRGVPVRWYPVPVGHFDSKRKRAGLRRVALESGGLSTWRNEAGPAPHFVVAG